MIQQTMCTSFKAEILQGVHDLTSNVLRLALYTDAASLGADTTVYTSVGEASGGGYSAGGRLVYGATISISGTTALVTFNNVTWPTGGFTARGGLLYNASKSNKAIAVLDFGATKTATSPFTVYMPENTVNTALLRIA